LKGNPRIQVEVKIGILHTIADAIYATPAGKIREAVSNARDNNASWIVILADRTTNSLTFFDNGNGITQDRFLEIFKSIGWGLLRNQPDTKLSYFGLGLMSIFQLGESFSLFTKPKNSKEYNFLGINTKGIFDKKNDNKSISFLQRYFDLTPTSEKSRKALCANMTGTLPLC